MNPPKSSTMWWSTLIPESFSTVRIVQAAPPHWYAQLNCARCACVRLPSAVRQAGISVTRSRGIDTAVALFRSAGRCSRIAVSERWVPLSRP